jgi:hypothetical protein
MEYLPLDLVNDCGLAAEARCPCMRSCFKHSITVYALARRRKYEKG